MTGTGNADTHDCVHALELELGTRGTSIQGPGTVQREGAETVGNNYNLTMHVKLSVVIIGV